LPLARWANNKKTFILGYHNKILLAIKCYIYTCRCLSKNLAKKEEKHKALWIIEWSLFCNKVLQQLHELLKTFRFSCLMAIIRSVL
jgi:hypothetical protein